MMQNLETDLWPLREAAHEYADEREVELELLEPERAEEVVEALSSRVVLYNDNEHTFDEVILQVAKALGCSFRHAALAAWNAHVHGKTQVFEGEMLECLNVSSILEEIALHTQVVT
ncbi:MAG TPA: ATP-dependent Clp protease adaptor ClpS [Candidatus Kapabacteria bacterium]